MDKQEFQWGLTRRRVSQEEVHRRDEAAKAEDGPDAGYFQLPHQHPTGGPVGWFYAPIESYSGRSELARRVANRLGPEVDKKVYTAVKTLVRKHGAYAVLQVLMDYAVEQTQHVGVTEDWYSDLWHGLKDIAEKVR